MQFKSKLSIAALLAISLQGSHVAQAQSAGAAAPKTVTDPKAAAVFPGKIKPAEYNAVIAVEMNDIAFLRTLSKEQLSAVYPNDNGKGQTTPLLTAVSTIMSNFSLSQSCMDDLNSGPPIPPASAHRSVDYASELLNKLSQGTKDQIAILGLLRDKKIDPNVMIADQAGNKATAAGYLAADNIASKNFGLARSLLLTMVGMGADLKNVSTSKNQSVLEYAALANVNNPYISPKLVNQNILDASDDLQLGLYRNQDAIKRALNIASQIKQKSGTVIPVAVMRP